LKVSVLLRSRISLFWTKLPLISLMPSYRFCMLSVVISDSDRHGKTMRRERRNERLHKENSVYALDFALNLRFSSVSRIITQFYHSAYLYRYVCTFLSLTSHTSHATIFKCLEKDISHHLSSLFFILHSAETHTPNLIVKELDVKVLRNSKDPKTYGMRRRNLSQPLRDNFFSS